MSNKKISLYYKDGSSDKVYHVQMESKDNGYVVNFQYGKRGSTLSTGTKTKDPVDLESATKTFNSIIKEKTSKGYTEGESGAVFQSQSTEDRITGVVPQLLNNVKNDTELEVLFKDDNWLMQEKYDGRRLMIKKEKETTAINKKGLSILIPQETANIIEKVSTTITTDGEIIGEKYYIFDILEYDAKDLKKVSAIERYNSLLKIKELNNYIVPTYFNEKDKRKAFNDILERKGEGVVFKNKDSLYISGRPASGGNQRKYKFWESATVKVIRHHKTKRSVTVAVYENGVERDVGNVTIPANYDIPKVGEIVEVIYLYCHNGEKGKLYQSKYKGVRDDQDISDCNLKQIKFKSENSDEDEDDSDE